MAPRSSVIKRRTGEVVSRAPSRPEPQASRGIFGTPAEFKAREAAGKARQRAAGERARKAIASRKLAESKLAEQRQRKAGKRVGRPLPGDRPMRDAQPTSAGPRGGSRVAVGQRASSRGSKGLSSFDRRVRSFLRLGTANPRRVLVLELVAVLAIVTVDQLAHGDAPEARSYVAPFIVYLVLAFVAELGGDGGARVATGLGALVLVALVLANGPGIAKALKVASGQQPAAVEGVG